MRDIHRGRGGLDGAAVPAAGSAGVEGPVDVDHAAVHVAQQADHPIAAADGLSLDDAGVVDHRLQQLAGRLGGEHHLAAVGLDHPAVLHQRLDRALVDRDVQQAVAGHVEGDGRAGGHDDCAEVGRDQALVADRAAQQGDVAAIGLDRALVLDRALAGAGEAVAAGHEVGVADVEGRGHQAADVHLGVGSEQDAVRIDQEDLAVGGEVPEDAGGVRSGDAIKGHGAAVGLGEADCLPLGDAEALPVDHRILARLGDRQVGPAGGHIGRSGRHRAAGGQGLGGRDHRQAADGAEQGGAGEQAQAGGAGEFGTAVHGAIPCFGGR